MKRLLKLCLCLMMAFTIVGCSQSTEEQEKVVTTFYEIFKSGEIEKLKDVCAADMQGMEDLMGMLDQIQEDKLSEEYGEKFAQEAKKFYQDVVGSVISSYEIKEVKEDGEGYLVDVDVVMKDFSKLDLNTLMGSADVEKKFEDYVKTHEKEFAELIMSGGQQAAMEKLLGDLGGEIFKEIKTKVDAVEESKGTMTFELEKENDKWIIKNIKESLI